MKIAVVSDAHLLQTYREVFDPIGDFREVLKEIANHGPDAILFAGDMFDKKKTKTTPVPHPEGEQTMMEVRPVLEEIGSPIYAIRGNHEDSRVLEGLDQTVENFHYVSDDWVSVDDFSIYCLETRYERAYITKSLKRDIESILPGLKEKAYKDHSILLSHENFLSGDREFCPDLRSQLCSEFEFVLNGHLHFYDPGATGDGNVIFLPALLPSKFRIGKYWQEMYEWSSRDTDFGKKSRKSPFGWVLIDEDLPSEFNRVKPSIRIVDLKIEITGLDQREVRSRFDAILNNLSERDDKDKLAICPRITGRAKFATSLLRNIPKQYENLLVDDIMDESTGAGIGLISGERVGKPMLTVEGLKQEIVKNPDKMVEVLSDEDMKVDKEKIQVAISNLLLEKEVLERGSGERVSDYIRNSLEEFISVLQKEKILELTPEDFNKFFIEHLKEVKY